MDIIIVLIVLGFGRKLAFDVVGFVLNQPERIAVAKILNSWRHVKSRLQ